MYLEHPTTFDGGCNTSQALCLSEAIIKLNYYGFYPEIAEDLTNKLADLFKDIEPDKDGNKKLGELVYHKSGLLKNHTGDGIALPPFDIPKNEDDDMTDRIKLLHKTASYVHSHHQHTLKQIAFAMSGKKPGIRKGAVGRSLLKITALVEKMEAFLEKDPGTNKNIVFRDLLIKIRKEIDGPLDKYANYSLYDRTTYDNTSSTPMYCIRYTKGELVEEIAAQLMTGALTTDRITNILNTITYEKKELVWFIPMESLIKPYLSTYEYKEKCIDCMINHGIALSVRTLLKTEHGQDYYANTFDTAKSYAGMLIADKSDIVAPIYDAIQAYNAYDSIEDEKVREFAIAAGYLVKDWKPDPDLWLRAAKLMPILFGDKQTDCSYYEERLGIDGDTVKDIKAIAETYAETKLDEISEQLQSENTKERIEKMFASVTPRKET